MAGDLAPAMDTSLPLPPPPPPPPLPPPPLMGSGESYMEKQHLCLRWNTHQSNLVQIMSNLLRAHSFVDCTIVCEGQIRFEAHRVVLAASSPYFHNILQDVPEGHCYLILPGVEPLEMLALLDYMYTGEVSVTHQQIQKVMDVAKELGVKGLFDVKGLGEKYMEQREPMEEKSPKMDCKSDSVPLPVYPSTTAACFDKWYKEIENGNGTNGPNSSSVISTSNISPPNVPSSSSSPPRTSYKTVYPSFLTKSPKNHNPSNSNPTPLPDSQLIPNEISPSPSSSSTQREPSTNKWPLSPSAMAAAMLSSVYESVPDMNPLKRKKLSSVTSMLIQDTPILHSMLAHTSNPGASDHPSSSMPLALPSASNVPAVSDNSPSTATNFDQSSPEGIGPHSSPTINCTEYTSDRTNHDEHSHSPSTDRSFDEDNNNNAGSRVGICNGQFNGHMQQPGKEWRRYKQYTREDVSCAIACVKSGEMSALQAAKKYGVPSRTLYDKVKKLGVATIRNTNRHVRRSPSGVEGSAAFPYAQGFGQPSLREVARENFSQPSATLTLRDVATRDENNAENEQVRSSEQQQQQYLPQTMPHPAAAALLDPTLFAQALETHGNSEALHAMALAAVAHAAANRITGTEGLMGSNGNGGPSANAVNINLARYANIRAVEQIMRARHERERNENYERPTDFNMERSAAVEDRNNQVEDLSVGRKSSESSADDKEQRPSPFTHKPPARREH